MDHSASVTRKSEANFVNSCELQYALIIVPLERILRLMVLLELLATFVRGSASYLSLRFVKSCRAVLTLIRWVVGILLR